MTHNPSPTAQAPDSAPAAELPAATPGQSDQAANPPDAGTPPRRVRIGSPLSLLAAIPGLARFQPDHSIVVLGTGHPRAEVEITLRYDLPNPADLRSVAAVAGNVLDILSAQGMTTAAAVGYGGDAEVSPVAGALRSGAAEAGITLTEVLRVEDNRYWSYICANPECCPPDGTPFDVADHPVTRAFAASGLQVFASREELAATVAAADGEPAMAMRRATRAAERQVVGRVGRIGRAGHRVARRRLVVAVGQPMVAEAISRYRSGAEIDVEFAAWVTVALREMRVRDDAWARMLPEHGNAHSRLWAHLTRLAQPGYVAAPASLLAFVAWQQGDGALANVALDRALADNRRYSMAKLLRRALDSGAPPSMARLPMTPEEVAASYDAQEAGEESRAAEGADIAEAG
jgi:Domain of unknown function (DUF4192)